MEKQIASFTFQKSIKQVKLTPEILRKYINQYHPKKIYISDIIAEMENWQFAQDCIQLLSDDYVQNNDQCAFFYFNKVLVVFSWICENNKIILQTETGAVLITFQE